MLPPDRRTKRLKRLAIQLAAQLPDNEDDALAVLELTKELVENFLSEKSAPPRKVLAVIAKH